MTQSDEEFEEEIKKYRKRCALDLGNHTKKQCLSIISQVPRTKNPLKEWAKGIDILATRIEELSAKLSRDKIWIVEATELEVFAKSLKIHAKAISQHGDEES
jgi:hypothetical protein